MDSFTQIVLGIATAEVCAGKTLGRKTLLYGSVLGTIPDLDVLVGQFMNPVDGVAIHRGLSHSLLFIILLSPLLGCIINKMEGSKINVYSAVRLVFWCLLTHVLLDLFTSWGTQVFWPLPDRISLKTIFVIDPLYTLPLLIFLIMGLRNPVYNIRRRYIWRGILISTLYLLTTCAIKLYALQQFKHALSLQQVCYEDLIVKPSAFNCILWNANVSTKNAYLLGDFSLFDTRPITFKRYDKNLNLSGHLKGNRDFDLLKNISEGWYILSREKNHYYFNDLRFGLLPSDSDKPQFAFSYVFTEKDGELKAIEVPKQKRDAKALMSRISKRIMGN